MQRRGDASRQRVTAECAEQAQSPVYRWQDARCFHGRRRQYPSHLILCDFALICSSLLASSSSAGYPPETLAIPRTHLFY